jgi:hypothetical protein
MSDWRESSFETTHANTVLVGRRAEIVWSSGALVHVVASTGSPHALRIVLHHGKKHGAVHDHVKFSSTHWCELTKHDVLGHTTAVVKLTKASSLEQNLDSLFERTAHECTSVVSVDTVTCDSHEHTTLSHDIDKKSHISVIDVRTIEGQDHTQLVEETCSSSLDTQYTKNLNEGIRVRLRRVHTIYSEDFSK